MTDLPCGVTSRFGMAKPLLVVAIIIANRTVLVELLLYIARKDNLGSVSIFNEQGFVHSGSVVEKKLF